MRIEKHLNAENTKKIKGFENLFTSKKELKVAYIGIISELFENINNKNHIFTSLKYWSKNKGHYSLIDNKYRHLLEVLKYLNIKYVEGNNAPKNGADGVYITAYFDARKPQIKEMRQLLQELKNSF